MRFTIAIAAATLAAIPGAASAQSILPPCAAEKCDASAGPDAQRLEDAWIAGTTDQRVKIRQAVDAAGVGGPTDWRAAADGYFDNAMPKAEPDWRGMREAAEAAIRGSLIDPTSAEFQWPHGFLLGSWKPFLQRHMTGYFNCGLVNAKNRMGGYTGSTAFAVIMNDTSVSYVTVDEPKGLNLADAMCSKTALPTPQPGMLDNGPPPVALPGFSVADEIAKLAALRDKGILTQAEFDAQKAALLRR